METKAINTKLKGHARVDVADVLRGLAVMGIIILHSIEHFNFYSFPDTAGQSAWLNFSDKAIWNGLFFMFGGKAYAIFALLFGFSFFIQDDNQRLRGNDFRLRFCWRLILLFLIGNINASFFTAEVLVLYSLVGFILPLTCRLKDKWIFALACLLLIQPLPLYYVIRACLDPEFVTPAIPTRSFWNATFAVQSNGNFLGLGSRTGIPNSRPFPARYADRAQGTFFERALEGMEQGTCRLTHLIFPFIWVGQYATRLYHK